MSYTLEGWKHGYGWDTIDLSGLLCSYCGCDMGVVAQYEISGCEWYKCGEFNYSTMAHSACHAFKELFDEAMNELGYEWYYNNMKASI